MLGIGVYILAWLIIINFLFRGFLSHHANNPAAAGLSPLI
jgi:hypothetical protein